MLNINHKNNENTNSKIKENINNKLNKTNLGDIKTKKLTRLSSRKTTGFIGRYFAPWTTNTLITRVNNSEIKNSIKLSNLLGEGAYGKVYRINNSGNTNIVYKSIISEDENDGKDEYRGLKFQYLLQKYLSSNNNDKLKYLCKLYEYGFINNDHNFLKIYGIMDNCGVELKKYIIELKKKGKLTIEIILYIIKECAEALKILHDIGYCHLDIKAENFLVVESPDGNIQIKIIDFGFISKIGKLISPLGTPHYMSPIMSISYLRKQKIEVNNYHDIFSLGCMLYVFIYIYIIKAYNDNIFNTYYSYPSMSTIGNDKIRFKYTLEYFESDKSFLLDIKHNNQNRNNLLEIFNILQKMLIQNVNSYNISKLIADISKLNLQSTFE